MPAKNLYREDREGIYSYVHNQGIEKRIIFNDDKDYEVFLSYLKDYLAALPDAKSVKKIFTVRGRTFRGTPHLPKNYFNQVELLAYSLMPDCFHLLLYQKTRGSIERLMRSLATRYSMYFNKKYQHTGALFKGPYKSIHVKYGRLLPHLTRYLHHIGHYSSYPEYLGQRETSWVKPKVVLSFFEKGTGGYKMFVDKYGLDQEEKELIGNITFESETKCLERKDLARRNLTRNVENYPNLNLEPLQRVPEFLAGTVVFLFLTYFGINNIRASTIKSFQPTPTPPVLSETVEVKEIKPKIILTVKITDGAESVNIRQKPTTSSEKIGKAKDGDTFEFVAKDSDWYEVKLADGSTGFISAQYVEEGGTNN